MVGSSLPTLVISCLVVVFLGRATLALSISHYMKKFDIDISAIAVDPEGIAVLPGTNTIWFTNKDTVVRFERGGLDGNLVQAGSVVTFPHGFGSDAEGIEYDPGTGDLLVTFAPDHPRASDAPGIYRFQVAGTLVDFSTTLGFVPVDRAEGIGIDPRSGATFGDIAIADEGGARALFFDRSTESLSFLFDTSFEAPEGISFFKGDLLLVDDGNEKSSDPDTRGFLIQAALDGTFIDMISVADRFGLVDPQGVAYDPIRDWVYLVGDDDSRILVLAPVPEPGAALVFFFQALALGATFRRQRRSREL